jgi:N-acetylglutamate synthase-like GNAT family acetyltransferase
MTVRQLPPEEWHKLAELPIASGGIPDPMRCEIVVAEEDGKIVGTWGLVMTPFLEGLWVEEEYRKSSAAPKLLVEMKKLLVERGVIQAFTLVQSTDVLILAHKAGFDRIPGDLMMIFQPQESV